MNAHSFGSLAFQAPPVDDRRSALDHLPADRVPLAVLDFETTGLVPGRDDRIVEVGVVRMDPERGGRWSETRFETLVNPQRAKPARVVKIHGITDSMVRTAPRFEESPSSSTAEVPVVGNVPFDPRSSQCRRSWRHGAGARPGDRHAPGVAQCSRVSTDATSCTRRSDGDRAPARTHRARRRRDDAPRVAQDARRVP
jgi:hypothetical protein